MFFRYARTCRRSKYIPEGTLVEAFWRLPGVRVVPMNKRHYVKYLLYAGLIAGALGLAMGAAALGLWWLTSSGALVYFLDWVGRIGYWGNLIMVLLIIAMQFPFMVGYGSMMLTSGFLFGFWGGLATLIVGCQIGLLFVGGLSRFFFKEKSTAYINKNAYVKALVEELLEHKIKFSFLVRITPLPVGLQNVMMAINVPVWLYVVSSFFGMLIEQVPMVYIGTTGVAKELAEIWAGEGEFDPVELVVIGITGAGILLVVAFLFYVSHKALKKVKQRQAEMETETAEEGEEALDLDEAYDAEDAEGVLELELEDWVDVGGGLEELESYAGTDINSAEHMQTVSSCERLCEMVPADDAPCMQQEYQVEVEEERDGYGRAESDGEVEIVLERDGNHVDMNTSTEEGIGRTPPKSQAVRKTSTEVRTELMAHAASEGGESPEAVVCLGLSSDSLPVARALSFEGEEDSMLEELEMFGDDDEAEAALDDLPSKAKKTALSRLHDAITKPKKLKQASSETSLVSSRPLTEDEDYV